MMLKKSKELIDMSTHSGEHPRMGATDVCPLVPIANISMEETAKWANKLGQRVGQELEIPVYLYEAAAKNKERENLANCRSGEYEGLKKKLVSEALEIFFDLRKIPGLKKKPSTSELIDWLKLLLSDDMPDEILKNADSSKAIPPLYGALLKNEQDVQLLERLAFMSRRDQAK